jgi:hypothetical protein
MPQADVHRPLTAKTQVRARVSPCWVCGGQSDIVALGNVFFRVLRFYPVSIISPRLSMLILPGV